jgi:glycosyltransferase involved in cell wall biosynthesis
MFRTSIIICTFNREKYLPACLDHLKQQTADPDSYEIVIVNNNSTDSTKSICENFQKENPHIHCSYIEEERPGLSYARNSGVNAAKGEIVCFIDDDAFAHRDYVQNLSNCIDKLPELTAFGGKILPVFESEKPKWLSRWLMPLVSVLDKGDSLKRFKGKEYPIGANMGCKKLLIVELNYFNCDLGRKGTELLGGEEKDFFYKLKKKEPIFYLPDVVVDHIIPENRLTFDYIKRMGIGIGRSERIRTLSSHKITYIWSLIFELVKWQFTILLFVFYTFGKWQKAKMLMKFRCWVTQGLIENKKN